MSHANANRAVSIRRRRLARVPLLGSCDCPECRALDAAHPGEGYQLALPTAQPGKDARA